MPYLTQNNRSIYYEIHGEGDALVILNGIMMSHASWHLFLSEWTKTFQVILLDFFDQGKSDKLDISYSQDIQVDVVKAVLDEINYERAHVLGISYGGEIAIQFAIKYPERVNKLLLFNTTAYTNPWLHDIGRGWVLAARHHQGELFYNVSIPIIYSPAFYIKSYDWIKSRKSFLYNLFDASYLDGMIRLIESAQEYDVREQLSQIQAPTLVVSSDSDFVTPAVEQVFIHKEIAGSTYEMIEDSGHASMYEQPTVFTKLIQRFLSQTQ
jgi:pimeloyl-ACP methyl ester carboxylesterase